MGIPCLSNVQDEVEYFGIDWEGPMSQQQLDQSAVQVPATPSPLTEAEFSEFVEQIPPLETSVHYAVDQY